MSELSADSMHAYDEHSSPGRRGATIEPNGSEFLVTINGAVFVALSLDQAKAFVERMRVRVS